MTRLAVLFVVLGACKGKHAEPVSEFGPKKIVQVEQDGFVVAIPQGYRYSSELTDAKSREVIQSRLPQAKILVAEGQPEEGMTIAISTIATPVDAFDATPNGCITVATGAARNPGTKIKAGLMVTLPLGKSCKIDMDVQGNATTQFYIPTPTKVLLITCLGGEATEHDVVCADVAHAATAK